jgi:hypothetical protein
MAGATPGLSAAALLDAAQRRWLAATDERDIAGVRGLIRQALLAAAPPTRFALSPEEASAAWTRLILLLLQEGSAARQVEAEEFLAARGFRFRLAPGCLAHIVGERDRVSGPQHLCATAEPACIGIAPDALPLPVLAGLQRAFAQHSPFWDAHRYDDPATGYFSYALELEPAGAREEDLIMIAIKHIRTRVASRFFSLRC